MIVVVSVSMVSVYALSPKVVSVSMGMFHGLALKDDGTVWTWGAPYAGGAGIELNNDKSASNILSQIPITNVTALCAATDNNLALKNDGTVWTWGYNEEGQLGDGTYIDSSVPVRVKGLVNITAIGGNYDSHIALRTDGTVWTWGDGLTGQLGDGTTGTLQPNGGLADGVIADDYRKNVPFRVNISGVKAVAAGWGYSLALKHDGTVWGWGDNQQGQLGTGYLNNIIPYPVQVLGISNVSMIAAGYDSVLALRDDGTIWEWGGIGGMYGNITIMPVPKQVSNLTDFVQISDGNVHFMALAKNGTVSVWGTNMDGEIAGKVSQDFIGYTPLQISMLTNITIIAAGHFNGLALGDDGTIYEWGRNMEGQIDPNSTSLSIHNPFIILKGTGIQSTTNPNTTTTINSPSSTAKNAGINYVSSSIICILAIFIGGTTYILLNKRK